MHRQPSNNERLEILDGGQYREPHLCDVSEKSSTRKRIDVPIVKALEENPSALMPATIKN